MLKKLTTSIRRRNLIFYNFYQKNKKESVQGNKQTYKSYPTLKESNNKEGCILNDRL